MAALYRVQSRSGDPTRVFTSMASLISSLAVLDRHLVAGVNAKVGTGLVLEDVQAGSIKATLKNVISEVPDEALKNADWKKIVGHFLVKAKYLILRWCEDRDAIDSRQDVKGLEEQLLAAAEGTDIKLLPLTLLCSRQNYWPTSS